MCYDVPMMNSPYKKYYSASIAGAVICILLSVIVLLQYRSISKNAPGAPANLLVNPTSQSTSTNPNQFSAAADVVWETVKGTIYPYSFSAPVTLALTTFPNDKYDMYAILWKGRPADQNVLMGVDNLKDDASRSHFIAEPKINYVREWYKLFGLKGVSSIEQFTNSSGLKGYRAKYFNSAGETSNTDVFFEILGHPEYVIHFASGVLAPEIFDKILDSVAWTE
jgi:hypothetical protein